MNDMTQIEADASGHVDADSTSAERDFAAEARKHGWTPKEEFKGDHSRWVDAETFVKRADEVMPLLKKQNEGLKREMDELKRSLRQASKHFEAAEKRAYDRAVADLDAKHTEAVEAGDVVGAKKIVREMEALAPVQVTTDDAPTQDQLRAELNTWVEQNDWYVLDDTKRRYADLQADLMGTADKWPGGQKAWLDELGKRVEKKFAEGETKRETKPVITNGGGNRPAGGRGGHTYADLPPAAKSLCDKWVKQGLIKDRETYVKSYDFS